MSVPFYQLDISSTSHFVNLTYHQLAILSTCHFINLPFCQLTILSTFNYVSSPAYELTFISTYHVIYLTFYQMLLRMTLFYQPNLISPNLAPSYFAGSTKCQTDRTARHQFQTRCLGKVFLAWLSDWPLVCPGVCYNDFFFVTYSRKK